MTTRFSRFWPSLVAAFATTAVYAAEGARNFAAPTTAPAPSSNVSNISQVTLALLLVLAAVFAAAWMLRRLRLFNQRGGHTLQIVAEIPLGPKQRAVLLKAGKKHVLVGVTPTNIAALHVLEGDDLDGDPINSAGDSAGADSSANSAAPSFKAMLRQSLGLK